ASAASGGERPAHGPRAPKPAGQAQRPAVSGPRTGHARPASASKIRDRRRAAGMDFASTHLKQAAPLFAARPVFIARL
ncbi:hypothetical protein, partial [Anaerotruncus colihominis]|uniref:hypothetical protein n=2 Tax=Anaerotruncus colihominis TaxID=169435 RepID=UPI003995947E